MRAIYRGYEIIVTREECLAGYSLLYISVFRLSDGFECVADVEDSGETVRSMIKYMKQRIDAELKEEDPWGEKILDLAN